MSDSGGNNLIGEQQNGQPGNNLVIRSALQRHILIVFFFKLRKFSSDMVVLRDQIWKTQVSPEQKFFLAIRLGP
jgi:hypothetical protein